MRTTWALPPCRGSGVTAAAEREGSSLSVLHSKTTENKHQNGTTDVPPLKMYLCLQTNLEYLPTQLTTGAKHSENEDKTTRKLLSLQLRRH